MIFLFHNFAADFSHDGVKVFFHCVRRFMLRSACPRTESARLRPPGFFSARLVIRWAPWTDGGLGKLYSLQWKGGLTGVSRVLASIVSLNHGFQTPLLSVRFSLSLSALNPLYSLFHCLSVALSLLHLEVSEHLSLPAPLCFLCQSIER